MMTFRLISEDGDSIQYLYAPLNIETEKDEATGKYNVILYHEPVINKTLSKELIHGLGRRYSGNQYPSAEQVAKSMKDFIWNKILAGEKTIDLREAPYHNYVGY